MKKCILTFLVVFLVPPLSFGESQTVEAQLKEINEKLNAIIEHQRDWDEWFVEAILADRTEITKYRKVHQMSTEELYRRWDYPKAYQDLLGRLFRIKNKEDQELWKLLSPIRKREFKKFIDELQN